jgi:hypothetical protein
MIRAVIVASLTVLMLSQAIPVDSAAAAPPVPPSDSKRPPPPPTEVRPRTPGWTPIAGFTGQKSHIAAASALLLPCAVCTYKAPLLTMRK